MSLRPKFVRTQTYELTADEASQLLAKALGYEKPGMPAEKAIKVSYHLRDVQRPEGGPGMGPEYDVFDGVVLTITEEVQ